MEVQLIAFFAAMCQLPTHIWCFNLDQYVTSLWL